MTAGVSDGTSPERSAVDTYFQRAAFALSQAMREGVDPGFKSMTLAFCVHACQSLREALAVLAESDELIRARTSDLPHQQLIELVRHHDIHGHPLPACDPAFDSMMMRSGQNPIRAESSHGVEVSWQDGRQPPVRTTPKAPSHGKIVFGGALTTRCQGGELYIQLPPSGPIVHLASALREFLVAAQELLHGDEFDAGDAE